MAILVKPDLKLFIDRLTIRTALTNDEEGALARLPFELTTVGANQDFVRMGEYTGQAFVVVAGFVGRIDLNAAGERQITAMHLPGDMADLNSVVQPSAASAFQALSKSVILGIPHVALRRVASKYPAIAEALWRDSTVDAAVLAQWVVNVGRRDARSRIIHLLCEIACRLGVADDEQVEFGFPVTQLQLADATGLTPVHVCRITSKLRADGLVLIRNKRVTIPDWKNFSRAGDFQRKYLQMDISPNDRLRIAA